MSALVPLEVPGWSPPDGWVVRRVDVTADYPPYCGGRLIMDVALIDLRSGVEVALRLRQGKPDFVWLDQYLTLMRAMPQTVCDVAGEEPIGRG